MNNILLFKETMSLLKNKKIKTKLSLSQMNEAIYLSSEEVNERIKNCKIQRNTNMKVKLVNQDSFQAAMELKNPLVLNFANPIHVGGGVLNGARAQEEDLCRKSSLFLSINSMDAWPFYRYHQEKKSYLASDGMILSKNVEIIRDEMNALLSNTKVVSVLTCSACINANGHLSEETIEKVMYYRIRCVLLMAKEYGYTELVLGAWGCGAFGLDAKIISKCFHKALRAINCFDTVIFAVYDKSVEQYNYSCFKTYFENYYKDLDTIKGCMVAGAIGDALGYQIEFDSYKIIQKKYGTLDHYILENGKALISDDTQMSLFTANGIMVGDTKAHMNKDKVSMQLYIYYAYLDWLHTQTESTPKNISWILRCNDLYAWRAPGTTCLHALESGNMGTVQHPINDSKGCGGIMRVAPLALYYPNVPSKMLDLAGANIAAITHGHPLGFMPAAALTHILHRIVVDKNKDNFDLYEVMEETMEAMKVLFNGNQYLNTLMNGMQKAIDLSKNKMSDIQNIKQLGEGWVAEETLFISMYCALKYQNNFDAAMIASVNHSGDSDSTGAVTGNIVGALVGFDSISSKWKENLECLDILLEISNDLYNKCPVSLNDETWMNKYEKVFE